ncbi:hypothetical protein SCD_n00760 [Sulfuricella denitrificans skB26]|uniref:Uncharacterized protein n=1 Tax=Sulfuricella denitrificans (strain DSM 22764 / NBRC 105220 / skB26) TaxID=1163617 RepID=S6B1Q2_SULDS|nr:DUF4198 domain-containing protein [Sulfuricella denitrificans]BAN34602.1 hypothetical protein SCD_n00760 [Sulfuricella denitrificans skB26]
MANQSLKISLLAVALLLCTLPALAHDLWLERDSNGYLLYQGHRHSAHAGAEFVNYDPAFAKSAVCVDDSGAARSPALVKSFPVRIAANCTALFVSFSSGYWSKTAWETRNVPKNQASGVVESWLSEESVKRIDRWTPAVAQPLSNGLELTPLSDPARLKPGDKLTVLVTERKQPRAGVPVAYGGDTRVTSGEDGKVAIRLRQGGMQLIEASLETQLADGKADTLIQATTLQFELPQ